jgi:hypothetical protein
MTPVGAEDWTTVSRSFVLKRKTSAPLPSDGASVVIGTTTLSAPGLSGTAGIGFGKKGREKADRLINDALRRALSASGVETRQTIEIADAQERGPARRHRRSSVRLPAQALRIRYLSGDGVQFRHLRTTSLAFTHRPVESLAMRVALSLIVPLSTAGAYHRPATPIPAWTPVALACLIALSAMSGCGNSFGQSA